jgi:hypothetical protein
MWITLVPVARLSRANEPGVNASASAISVSNSLVSMPVAADMPFFTISPAISSSARLVKWLTRPALAP